MPEEFVASANAASASKKRTRDVGATAVSVSAAPARPPTSALSSASQLSFLPLPPPPTPSPPRPSLPAVRLPYDTVTSAFQSSGLAIHPSLQVHSAPAPPRFSHPLDPLVIPPPASRRRKAVDRCTSPSHFLATPLALTPYGPDAHIDLPLRSRMDSWLGGCVSLFFSARAPVVGDDAGKMWEDVSRDRPAYTTIERLLSPLRKRRVREEWSAREVSVFEVGMSQHPKDFAAISRLIGSKATSEVVHFYYTAWKHSQHYWRWKLTATAPSSEQQQRQQQPQHSVNGRASRAEIVLLGDEDSKPRQGPAHVVAAPPPTAPPLSSSPPAAAQLLPVAASSPAAVVDARRSPPSLLQRKETQTGRTEEQSGPAPQPLPPTAVDEMG